MAEREGLKYHSTAAFVRDIEAAKKFYTEVLGLTIELNLGQNVILEGGITLWEVFPAHIIAECLGVGSITDRRVNRFEFYFETRDIDAVVEKLKAKNVDFLHPLHEETWGQRTIRFFDPDRHLIEIGEAMETFVKRMHAAGMTPQQASQKTSIPLEKVIEILDE